MSWFRSTPRRFSFPAIAALLAAGAPLGLILVRAATAPQSGLAALAVAVRQDDPTFVYVTVSTLAVFTLFGYIVGRQADALADLSIRDPLTGLANHRAFVEGLEAEVARSARYGGPLSLLIADVDGLKAINDRGGHSAGNLALRTVAGAFLDHARRTDLVARIGGDEFALIAPRTEAGDAWALGDRIRSLLARAGQDLTVSVGVATADAPDTSATGLFEAADRALYDAKRQGRNRVAGASTA
jgi:diguanylate cyclase (GGDEF)-like protein